METYSTARLIILNLGGIRMILKSHLKKKKKEKTPKTNPPLLKIFETCTKVIWASVINWQMLITSPPWRLLVLTGSRSLMLSGSSRTLSRRSNLWPSWGILHICTELSRTAIKTHINTKTCTYLSLFIEQFSCAIVFLISVLISSFYSQF